VNAKTPPTFTTTATADVEVDIAPAELEEAGWVYVGPEASPSTDLILGAVMRWHNDNHADSWRWCRHELCIQLNQEA
jgi:hypothetical protein